MYIDIDTDKLIDKAITGLCIGVGYFLMSKIYDYVTQMYYNDGVRDGVNATRTEQEAEEVLSSVN